MKPKVSTHERLNYTSVNICRPSVSEDWRAGGSRGDEPKQFHSLPHRFPILRRPFTTLTRMPLTKARRGWKLRRQDVAKVHRSKYANLEVADRDPVQREVERKIRVGGGSCLGRRVGEVEKLFSWRVVS